MKGRYTLMIYAGIDIVKFNHFASAIYSDGKKLMKTFKFINDVDGFQLLQSRLSDLSYVRTTTSSILNRRHTTMLTPLQNTLLPINTTCMLNPLINSIMPKITYTIPRQTKSSHTSLPKHL